MINESQCTATAESVVKKYANMVYRLAFAQVRSKSDADDIFQEVFLRYVQSKAVFESEEHRKAWLIRVTVNCAKKHWSSAWRRKMVPLEDSYPFELPEETGVNEAMWKLASKYRSVIHLFYYEGYSITEISSILGVRESTIRTQLTRARARLSEMLKGDL